MRVACDVPRTEGIKYAGSKLKLLPHILQLVKKVDAKTVLDGFSGTTRVSQALARLGYTVVCNDVAVWSKVFGMCYLLNTEEARGLSAAYRSSQCASACGGVVHGALWRSVQ